MIEKKTWDEFRNNGLLWWVNRILHLLGWALVYEDGQVYPARTKFRGFGPEQETEGYIKVSKYLEENIDVLLEEAES